VNNASPRLIVFATSTNPDSYINAICYAVAHKNIKNITIATISDHAYIGEPTDTDRARQVLERVLSQLRGLSEGRYQHPSSSPSEVKETPLEDPKAQEIYKHVLSTLDHGEITAQTVPINVLFSQLRLWIDAGSVTFDVTGLQKNLLVDVVSSSLLLDFSEVYSFEIRKEKVTHGIEDIFHRLVPNQDYIYRNITQSEPVRKAVRRINRWKIQVKSYLVLALIVFFIPIALAEMVGAEKTTYYISVASALVTLMTATLPFVREKFE
jgi:hypothetical protein